MTTRTRSLNLNDIDRADALASMIEGILDCVSAASQTECLPDEAIPNACWAASTLLEQLRTFWDGKPQTSEVTNG